MEGSGELVCACMAPACMRPSAKRVFEVLFVGARVTLRESRQNPDTCVGLNMTVFECDRGRMGGRRERDTA